jgi:hypothetical protein
VARGSVRADVAPREGKSRPFASVWALFLITGAATTGRLAARVACLAILAKTTLSQSGDSHEDTDVEGRGFGRLIDLARAEPVAAAKHRRPAVLMMAVEEYEWLTALELTKAFAFADECNYWQASI